MNKFDNGGPAFPTEEDMVDHGGVPWVKSHTGMTLWDYYAAAALQGLISSDFESYRSDITPAQETTFFAAQMADAMLAERRKRFEGEQE